MLLYHQCISCCTNSPRLKDRRMEDDWRISRRPPGLLNVPPAAFAALPPRCSGSPSSKSWVAAAATNPWSDRPSRPPAESSWVQLAVSTRGVSPWHLPSIYVAKPFPVSLLMRELATFSPPGTETPRPASTMILFSCLIHWYMLNCLIWLSNSDCGLWTPIGCHCHIIKPVMQFHGSLHVHKRVQKTSRSTLVMSLHSFQTAPKIRDRDMHLDLHLDRWPPDRWGPVAFEGHPTNAEGTWNSKGSWNNRNQIRKTYENLWKLMKTYNQTLSQQLLKCINVYIYIHIIYVY